jgi:hypothetical protein
MFSPKRLSIQADGYWPSGEFIDENARREVRDRGHLVAKSLVVHQSQQGIAAQNPLNSIGSDRYQTIIETRPGVNEEAETWETLITRQISGEQTHA